MAAWMKRHRSSGARRGRSTLTSEFRRNASALPPRTSLVEYSAGERLILAGQKGFAGRIRLRGNGCEWIRDVDYQPATGRPDIADIELDGDFLYETGDPGSALGSSYREIFQRISRGNQVCVAAQLVQSEGPTSKAFPAKAAFSCCSTIVSCLPNPDPSPYRRRRTWLISLPGRPDQLASSYLDCEYSFGRISDDGSAMEDTIVHFAVPNRAAAVSRRQRRKAWRGPRPKRRTSGGDAAVAHCSRAICCLPHWRISFFCKARIASKLSPKGPDLFAATGLVGRHIRRSYPAKRGSPLSPVPSRRPARSSAMKRTSITQTAIAKGPNQTRRGLRQGGYAPAAPGPEIGRGFRRNDPSPYSPDEQSRSDGKGLHDPEFSRMASEKLAVIGDSGRAMGQKLPAMNRLLLQHWDSQMQHAMSSAFAMAACRSPVAAAAVGYRAGTAMMGDIASLNLALIRFGQGFSLAASAPVLRIATANARRLALADNSRRA